MLKERLNILLKTAVSYYDTAQESFYHGLLLGLLAMTNGEYKESSNQESGDGRYDLCLTPTRAGLPGILIELKAVKKCDEEQLTNLAKTALHQIEEMHYDRKLRENGVTEILKYGVAFSGSHAEVVMGQ